MQPDAPASTLNHIRRRCFRCRRYDGRQSWTPPPRRAMPPRHLADLDEAGRAAAVADLGLPAFRGKQLANQYYGRLIADPHQMTDLPAAVRDQVADALFPRLLDAVREIECDAGETRKMLWRAIDGTTFESVLMRYPQRNTVCISSQAGCGMACPFCATGQGGLTRNLSTAEILEQVRAAAVELRDRDGDGIAADQQFAVPGRTQRAGDLIRSDESPVLARARGCPTSARSASSSRRRPSRS